MPLLVSAALGSVLGACGAATTLRLRAGLALGVATALASGAGLAAGAGLGAEVGVVDGVGSEITGSALGATGAGGAANVTPAAGARAAVERASTALLRDSQKVSREAAAAEARDQASTRRLLERLTARKSAAATTLRSAPRYAGAERGALSAVVGESECGAGTEGGGGARSGCSGDKSKLMVAAGRAYTASTSDSSELNEETCGGGLA